jgi:hypothetical protein
MPSPNFRRPIFSPQVAQTCLSKSTTFKQIILWLVDIFQLHVVLLQSSMESAVTAYGGQKTLQSPLLE